MIFKVAPEETEDSEEARLLLCGSLMASAAYAVRPEEKPADGLVLC